MKKRRRRICRFGSYSFQREEIEELKELPYVVSGAQELVPKSTYLKQQKATLKSLTYSCYSFLLVKQSVD